MTASEPGSSAEAATRTAAKLGYPLTMKAAGPGIVHKTELDLARLELADAAAVVPAFDDSDPRLPGEPGAEVVVQPMAGPGVELIRGDAGVRRPRRGRDGVTYVEQLGISSHRRALLGAILVSARQGALRHRGGGGRARADPDLIESWGIPKPVDF